MTILGWRHFNFLANLTLAPRKHAVSWGGSGHLCSALCSLVGLDPWLRTFEIPQTLRRLEKTGSWETSGFLVRSFQVPGFI